MPDSKISALTAATAVAAANELIINEAGTSKKVTASQMRDFLGVVKQSLSANATANATTTLATVMTTTGVAAGTYQFQYFIRYQSAATTTGVKFKIGHSGTVTAFVANSRYGSTGGAAATGAATQAGASATGNIHESFTVRALASTFQPTVSVDAINADMLMIIEGIIVVTATGDLILQHASEVAASSQVMAGTSLVLIKIS